MTDIPIALKATLVDADGVPYREFRRGLIPRYGRVWRDIALGYLALIGIPAVICAWDPKGATAIAAAVLGAFALGFVMAYVNNFFHEAAHYNLHPDRETSDRLANLVIGWLFGSSIASYRTIHFQHHRALGTTEDSENSYFDPLGVRYMLTGLFGLKAVLALRRYRQSAGGGRLGWIVLCAVANLAIAGALAVLGPLAAAVAWLAGLLLVFPFFVSLRQLLEHRAEDADHSADYRTVDHGAVNRLFGDSVLAQTMGSAGFNRHALHHWEPNVSYTRLRDIERYLLRTEVAPLVRARRTTYSQTFLRLFEL